MPQGTTEIACWKAPLLGYFGFRTWERESVTETQDKLDFSHLFIHLGPKIVHDMTDSNAIKSINIHTMLQSILNCKLSIYSDLWHNFHSFPHSVSTLRSVHLTHLFDGTLHPCHHHLAKWVSKQPRREALDINSWPGVAKKSWWRSYLECGKEQVKHYWASNFKFLFHSNLPDHMSVVHLHRPEGATRQQRCDKFPTERTIDSLQCDIAFFPFPLCLHLHPHQLRSLILQFKQNLPEVLKMAGNAHVFCNQEQVPWNET